MTNQQGWRIKQKSIKRSVNSNHFSSASGVFYRYVLTDIAHSIDYPVYVYVPDEDKKLSSCMISVHGKKRNGNKYRNIFVNSADSGNMLVIAPEFSDTILKRSWSVIAGNMFPNLRTDKPRPKERWTFSAIDIIFQIIVTDLGQDHLDKYSLYGHSAGAQFVHRYVLFSESTNLDQAYAANAGWYTEPNEDIEFPYGVKDLLAQEQIVIAFSKKLTILVGNKDTGSDLLRVRKELSGKGANRIERAHLFMKSSQSIAKRLGAEFNWQMGLVDNVGHSSKATAVAAYELMANSIERV